MKTRTFITGFKAMAVAVFATANLCTLAQVGSKAYMGGGVTTALFDGSATFNQHIPKYIQYGDMGYITPNFYMHSSSAWSVFYDYQFCFNDDWSLEAKFKYQSRTDELRQILTGGFSARTFYYGDLSVPVTANRHLWMSDEAWIELCAGFGVRTLGLVGRHSTRTNPDEFGTHGTFLLDFATRVDVYGVLCIQMAVKAWNVVAKPFVAWSVSPFKTSAYVFNPSPEAEYRINPNRRTNELEIGVTILY